MDISRIDFQSLKVVKINLNWGKNLFSQERFFYEDDKYIFKIWHRNYQAHKMIVKNGTYTLHNFKKKRNMIASIDCGLINQNICPAFVDYITEQKNICRGYVMLKGKQIKSETEVNAKFLKIICENSITSGFAHTDLCTNNIIKISNGISLIDIDSCPTELCSFNISFEYEKGSLRQGSLSPYKNFLLQYYCENKL